MGSNGAKFLWCNLGATCMTQGVHPSDVFSVLLILGGDIVARALAQLAGSGLTPVTFSFGWVAYSVSALVSAVGENKLMPQNVDCKCKVINGKSGYSRDNSSWVIGRIVRDFDTWSGTATKEKTKKLLGEKWEELKSLDKAAEEPTRAGLVVTIYEPSATPKAGLAKRDLIFWSGLFIMLLQLGIAAIPCGLFGDWGILIITACGNVLAIVTGVLPQWKKEKWACRPKSKYSYILTRGNGAQHAIVILGNGHGLNLEDLASGQSNVESSTNTLTRAVLLALSIFWVLLLIAAAGLRGNTWFLLAIGGIGIVQNVFVAGRSMKPENYGIHLDYVEVFGKTKVMDTLLDVEQKYPGIGRSMRDEFFPGKLPLAGVRAWEQIEQSTESEPQAKAPRESQDDSEETQAEERQVEERI
ncbi:hypothetical protein DTO013E5_3546 [Penicillium roqueforti]|nr:hypothetical protein DTO012A1_3827 [Penicillium roqueforti]KAI2749665.1 hypothetical protein DTO013F2_5182 [Penicillium roqueforti]KAI3133576.1 hypothetical protein CBS147326_4688 [Penicillium roqueforti]KAI3213633.1 hypothetical protein DTO013E5_3546 [Penicillium roqueforti]